MYRLDVLTVIIAACTFRHTLRFCRLGELPQSGTPQKIAQPPSWAFSFLGHRARLSVWQNRQFVKLVMRDWKC